MLYNREYCHEILQILLFSYSRVSNGAYVIILIYTVLMEFMYRGKVDILYRHNVLSRLHFLLVRAIWSNVLLPLVNYES